MKRAILLFCIYSLASAALDLTHAAVEPDLPSIEDLPGTVFFHGRYKHTNTGREIAQPAELWLKKTEVGAVTAFALVPFMDSTEIAVSDKTGRFTQHQMLSRPSGGRPTYQLKLEFEDGKTFMTRRGLRADCDRKPLPVPPGAWFDPNTRPDSYCAANILLRDFAVKEGKPGDFRMFDIDNSGEGFVDYMIRIEHVGKERVEVPAGTFEAHHLVLTQKTFADTWFKKRAGHITDFWVLDNFVIVRIRRNREPYEVALLDYRVPEKLPGHLAGPVAKASDTTGAPPRSSHASDWEAFIREVDQAYPFFDLKGIRRDWMQTKALLSEEVKTCKSDAQFLWIVDRAVRCLRDAHMGVRPTVMPEIAWPKRYYPGVSFMPATQDRVVIMATEVHTDALKPGTVVTKIDGKDARKVLEEKSNEAWSLESPYLVYVSSPQRARLFAYRWPLLSATNRTHTLRYLAEGQERDVQVASDLEPRGWPHTYNMPTALTRADRSLSYTKLPSGAGYIYLRSVTDEMAVGIRKALDTHRDAKGWIVDLRGNGGGGYGTNLLAALKAIPRPVVGIIDAGCISAGETLARDMVQLSGARLMGARTAGASSSKRQWQFPSGFGSVTFSTRSRWRNDGQPIEFNGIVPDDELEAVPEEVSRGLNSEILRAEEFMRKTAAGK